MKELRCGGGEGRLRARAGDHRDKDQNCGGQPGDACYPTEGEWFLARLAGCVGVHRDQVVPAQWRSIG